MTKKEIILIIGSGAREHAIAAALARSSHRPELVCFGETRNPAIKDLCRDYRVGRVTDGDAIFDFVKEWSPTMAVIGPEAPLAVGIADLLWAAKVPVIGPRKQLARIESSKGFARDLLARHDIPGNPYFKRFDSLAGLEEALSRFPDCHVIKDDGLAGGKGVKVYGDHLHSMAESIAFCQELVARKHPFVFEEKIEGEEFSLLSFCDGKTLRHMPVVQDHKRAYEGDKGPNTGGMGTYTDADHKLPFLTDADIAAAQSINERVALALGQDCGALYQGILYGGFMATKDGVKLIEYNARFGDPEALNLLLLLETDFLTICRAIVNQTLDQLQVVFSRKASVCKYIVPEGYPENARKGDIVQLPPQLPHDVKIFFGAVEMNDAEELIATGSRTAGIVARGDTIAQAEAASRKIAGRVPGRFFYRADIGAAGLIEQRVRHMKALRSV